MARHRSPLGRRAHLGLPLPSIPAAAGAGVRSAALPTFPPALRARVVATAVAGGALAAAGQAALTEALPAAADGVDVLRLGLQELTGTPPQAPALSGVTAAASAPLAPATAEPARAALDAGLAPVDAEPAVAEPVVAEVADLVKAADLQQRTAEAAARAAESVRADADASPASEATTAGAVHMVDGRVTSGFGARWGRQHRGLDIAAPIGTPIRVPLAGTVVDSGPASGFGLWVRVRHADGTVTVYGHVNRSLVRVGQEVAPGQVIAEVGNRGRSTGPHLHMEVETPVGRKIDPRPWLDEQGIGYA